MTESTEVDLKLVGKVLDLIPDHSWTQVRQVIVTSLVDNMPGSVIERLTGSYDAFDQTEAILLDYYPIPEKQYELIVDGFKIMGPANCLELLSSLNLSAPES